MSLIELSLCIEYPFKLFSNAAFLAYFMHFLKILFLDEAALIMLLTL